MKKTLIRIVLGLGILLVVALVAVFFSLNSIVKKGVETVGPQITKVDVKLGSANISPFGGSGQLSKLFVGNPEGYKTASAIQVGDVKVAVKVGSVLSDTIMVEQINIQAPEITMEGTLTGNNLSKILENLNSTSETKEKVKNEPTAGKKEKKFIVKDIVVNGAKVHLNITALGQTLGMTVPIPDIHLQNVGTGEGGVSAAELSRQILKPILAGAVEAGTKAIADGGKQLKDIGKNLGKGSVDDLNKAAKGVTDLFKKKQ
ncbi:hypothetical protein [Pedosphaera parvula]|uniref:AsmA domain-containing protein n=1 Tax=Pedosphaera parvula (strain Ellin514) TaxID=320771 RepID=B9XID3_PEDPL|nr:hypothetical protein [Pedosphaera parvula]EEF60394.1 conserved hypothetical protein [Pedosphaera parvula Ellin514]